MQNISMKKEYMQPATEVVALENGTLMGLLGTSGVHTTDADSNKETVSDAPQDDSDLEWGASW